MYILFCLGSTVILKAVVCTGLKSGSCYLIFLAGIDYGSMEKFLQSWENVLTSCSVVLSVFFSDLISTFVFKTALLPLISSFALSDSSDQDENIPS